MLPPTTTPWLVCSSNKLNWYLPPYEEWLHDFCHSASSPPIRWNRFNNNKMFANFFLTGSIIYAEDGGVGWSVSESVDRGSSDEHWPMTPRILFLLVSVGLTFWNSPRLAPKEERLARLSRKKHVQGSACARWSFHVINIRRPPAIHCEFNQEEPHLITCIQNNINSLVPLLNNALNAGEEDRDRDMAEMDPKDEWTEVARAVD